MDFELRRAREKLEKEQKERKERAKLRLDRERKAKEEARKQREAIEAVHRSRRLDAIQAQLKVDEQMQENLLAGRGIVFSRILEAVSFQGSGDKIKLPPSCFTGLSDQGAFDKGPLYFQLSVVHQEGSSEMIDTDSKQSTTPLSNLFPVDSPKAPLIEVQYVWLPKGTYAKLQPDVVGFSDLPNHKAVLETSLRQHATLSEGDVITVNHGILTYKLQVLELRPSSSVSVLETDIEVDVVGPDSGLESSQPVLKPLIFGKAESGIIAAEDVRVEVRIEAETNNSDTDLYMSKHPLMFPTRHQHEMHWCIWFQRNNKVHVAVSVQENSNHKVGQQAGSSSSMDIDAVECRNCKHFIPSRSIALHEAFCSRHNIVCSHPGCGIVLRIEESKNHLHCDKCGQAFQQGEIEKHMKVFHETTSMPMWGGTTPGFNLSPPSYYMPVLR
ncbi:hypothetical protein NC652_033662 [Populus alba x Populus x berolinensis]|nr:hypothetical protein NC652_033662 [Populus alba x Populus x berolinensis]